MVCSFQIFYYLFSTNSLVINSLWTYSGLLAAWIAWEIVIIPLSTRLKRLSSMICIPHILLVYIVLFSWLSLLSLMRLATAVVLSRTSWARARPGWSCLFKSFCTTIAQRFSASWTLIWFCSLELNDPTILFKTCSADLAWTVVSTRWPVSERRIAFLIPSRSLI